MSDKSLILELLVDKQNLSEKDIPKVLTHQVKTNTQVEDALIQTNLATDVIIAKAYADYFKIPFYDNEATTKLVEKAYELARLLPERFARANRVIPLFKEGEALTVGVINPSEIFVVQEIYLYTGMKVNMSVVTLSALEQSLATLYGARDEVKELATGLLPSGKKDESDADEDEVLDLNKPIPATRETKVVLFVNKMFETSIQQRASDIHIEPYAEEIRIRFRVDGILNEVPPPPKSMFIPLVSRIKILAKLDIAE